MKIKKNLHLLNDQKFASYTKDFDGRAKRMAIAKRDFETQLFIANYTMRGGYINASTQVLVHCPNPEHRGYRVTPTGFIRGKRCGACRKEHKETNTQIVRILHSNNTLYLDYVTVRGNMHGEYKRYHVNGQLWQHCYYVHGVKVGELRSYYKNGQLEYEVTYVDGEKHGVQKEYHENGQLLSSGCYVDGKMQGEYVKYYEDGQLFSRCYLTDGYMEGEYLSYYADGTMMTHALYLGGDNHGECSIYASDGGIRTHFFYDNGYNITLEIPKNIRDRLSEEDKVFIKLKWGIPCLPH